MARIIEHYRPKWLGQANVGQIMEILDFDGRQSRFVGGCVRQTVLGQEANDIDIATCFVPEQVMDRASRAKVKSIATGLDHGTVTLYLDGQSFEVTTLRRDIVTDGRHAKVTYTDDWIEDITRRDFTMNTLLMDQDGQIFDLTGCGFDDLQAGRVVYVGDPETRIKEDYLRILRYFRFTAWYGAQDPSDWDQPSLQASISLADYMSQISTERVTMELVKIFSAPNPLPVLKILWQNKILSQIWRSGINKEKLDQFIQNQIQHKAIDHRTRIALTIDEDAVRGKLTLPKTTYRFWMDFLYARELYQADYGAQRILYLYDRDILVQAALYNNADAKMIKALFSLKKPVLPISGKDLMEYGFEPGPVLGAAIEQAEGVWIESGFTFDKEKLIDMIV